MRPQHDVAGKIEKRSAIPAANAYKMPSLVGDEIKYSAPGKKVTAAKWSMTGRSDHGSFATVIKGVPGPGAHKPENCMQVIKPANPKYTLRPRHYMPASKSAAPGPKYSVANHNAQKPKRTIPGGGFGKKATNFMYVAIE